MQSGLASKTPAAFTPRACAPCNGKTGVKVLHLQGVPQHLLCAELEHLQRAGNKRGVVSP